MIDIHSHILYGLDDGSSSAEETIEMLNIAVSEGISAIIATPHYIVGNNEYDRQSLLDRYEDVLEIIKGKNIPIELKLGNELFVDYMLPQKLKQKECFTLAGSRYVLVEFSNMTRTATMENLIYELELGGYIPVIAHPERIFDIHKDIDELLKLIEEGCFLQSNIGAITGVFGNEAQKMIYELLDRHMISILATDAHNTIIRAPRVKNAYEIVKKRYGYIYADELFVENAEKILCDKNMDRIQPKTIIRNNFARKLKYAFSK